MPMWNDPFKIFLSTHFYHRPDYGTKRNYSVLQNCARRHNDQAHPPPEAGATGGTTKAQAVGGRVQRLVKPVLVTYGAMF